MHCIRNQVLSVLIQAVVVHRTSAHVCSGTFPKGAILKSICHAVRNIQTIVELRARCMGVYCSAMIMLEYQH